MYKINFKCLGAKEIFRKKHTNSKIPTHPGISTSRRVSKVSKHTFRGDTVGPPIGQLGLREQRGVVLFTENIPNKSLCHKGKNTKINKDEAHYIPLFLKETPFKTSMEKVDS